MKVEVDVVELTFTSALLLTKEENGDIVRIAKQYKRDCTLEESGVYNLIPRYGTTIFLARLKGQQKIVGFAHLVDVVTLVTKHGRVEDVAVDNEYQKCGIGRQMTERLIDHATNYRKLQFLDLTSRPSREIANHLYPNLGFELRETNVYRLELNPTK